MNPIDLHLVSWNRPKMTELAIKTISRNTQSGTYRLHVLDNNSSDSTKIMLTDMAADGLINDIRFMDENVGLERARNIMLSKSTESEYFVCIDNDCLPPPNWLQDQIGLMQHYKDYAAISQRTQVMIGTGNIFEESDIKNKPLTDFPHPGGSFRMMRTKATREVGGWDRDSEGRGAEERYIGGKLRDSGYKTAFATHIQCLHLFGNRAVTKERWGYEEGMLPEQTGHSDIWHPALTNGDNFDDVAAYAGRELAKGYFS